MARDERLTGAALALWSLRHAGSALCFMLSIYDDCRRKAGGSIPQ
jgi:hypothetical protein